MRVIMLLALTATLGSVGCGKKEEPKQAANDLKGVVFDKPKVEPPPPVPQPQPAPMNVPQVKPDGPRKGLVQSVRGASLRPMRLNELKQIAIFMRMYTDERNGKTPQNDDEFITYIQRDANGIAQAIKEKYYALNPKVNMRDASSIVAYETLVDGIGFQAARVDGSVGLVSIDELTKAVQ